MDSTTPETGKSSLTPTGVTILRNATARGAVEGHAAALDRLKASGFVRKLGEKWYITPLGRTALEAHNLQQGGSDGQ